MMSYMVICMTISLDTNVWIFGLFGNDPFCERILGNLSKFDVVVPNQVRKELENNLPKAHLKRFYQIVRRSNIQLNFEVVPTIYITTFKEKGLKKGDAIIGGFAEWQKVDTIISDNRDFLRGLAPEHYFEVMSPQEFCEAFEL